MLSDSEMSLLRAETEPLLKRSLVISVNESGEVNGGRTSSNAWIKDFEPGNLFHFIAKRVGLITGFKTGVLSATEDLQVANYMPGGFYGPHFDAGEDPVVRSTYYLQIIDKIQPLSYIDMVYNATIFPLPCTFQEMAELISFYMDRGDRIATFMIYVGKK